MEERYWDSREAAAKAGAAMDGEKNAKILEVDPGKPQFNLKRRGNNLHSSCSTLASDQNNRSFVVKNGGFVALSAAGAYRVLSVVDQTHLPTPVKDRVTGATLGYTCEVKMKSSTGGGKEQEYVVALL